MKGQWCDRNTRLFCQEDQGCGNCEVYLAPTPQQIAQFRCKQRFALLIQCNFSGAPIRPYQTQTEKK